MRKITSSSIVLAGLVAAALPISAGVASAAAKTPVPDALPQISGTRIVGDELTTTRGTWSSKPTHYAYQWLLCGNDGKDCSPIAGLTSRTIKLPAKAANLRLRVTVRATNSGGTRSVTSHSTGLIAPATTTPPPVTPPPVTPPPVTPPPVTPPPVVPPTNDVLFSDSFDYPNGLITNEYSHWNPGHSDAKLSSKWDMTSGSLFEKDGTGWTGTPDGCSTSSPSSSPCTASDVFRLNTNEQDFGNVTVSLDVLNNSQTSSSRTPSVDWDGVHVWLRYQSEFSLYYASFNRRDGHVVIKKKCVGGDENGGTYYELGQGEVSGFPIPFGSWQHLSASVQNTSSGGVTITMSRNGTQLLQATDNGTGCAPITAPGGVGIRGDNDNFQFDNFTVTKN